MTRYPIEPPNIRSQRARPSRPRASRRRARSGRETAAVARTMAALSVLAAALTAGPAAAQSQSLLERVRGFDLDRLEIGEISVLYPAGDAPAGSDVSRVEAVRRAASRYTEAAAFYADALGGPRPFTVVFLGPRDWPRAAPGQQAVPWGWQPDRMLLVPVQPDLSPLQSGPDTPEGRRLIEVIGLHELGHVLVAAYLHPSGFRAERPPVRWFEEVLASYLAQTYMEERRPELARFTQRLARDVVRRVHPRFTSLRDLDEHYDAVLTAPQGADNLGWYQNAFNLRAAELYDAHGLEFLRRVRRELTWSRFELWTTESVLDELEAIAPGTRYWANELESGVVPGY